MFSRQLLPEQENPKGQQLSPQVSKVLLSRVVWIAASGCWLGSCRLISQVIGWIALQSMLLGQQIADVPLSIEMQLVPLPQQMFPGSRESTVEQAVAVEFAHVKSRACSTPSACAAVRADERATAEGTVLEIRHMRLSLWSMFFGAILLYERKGKCKNY